MNCSSDQPGQGSTSTVQDDSIIGPKKRGNERVKSFPSRIDEKLVDYTWSLVKNGIEEILRKNSVPSFEEVYRNAYSMVLMKCSKRLYDGIQETIRTHLETTVRENVLRSLDGDFLVTMDRCWTNHQTSMAMIRDILMFMEKKPLMREVRQKQDPVYDLGVTLFRDVVVHGDRVRDHLRESLLAAVMKERNGEAIDRTSMKNVCQMLVVLGMRSRDVYRVNFEIPFLAQCAQFYEIESRRLLAENSALDYVRKADSRIEEEVERAINCFEVSIESQVVRVVEEELFKKQINDIVEKENFGVVFMLNNRRTRDLSAMQAILSKYPDSLKVFSERLHKYLLEEGQSLLKGNDTQSEPASYVQRLLSFKENLEYCLHNLITSGKTLKETILEFEHFLIFNPKLPRYISLFIDKKLRKVVRDGIDENDLELYLEKAMVLFRILQDKDVFETYYRQHLAKRLLLNKSVCVDHEKHMISKLKVECGCRFTSKLEGMFTDLTLSNTVVDLFKQSKAPSSNSENMDLTVRVLTTRFWPLPNVTPKCILPSKAYSAYEEFQTFYLDKYNGRQLRLQPQLGTADIIGVFYDNNRGYDRTASVISSNDGESTTAGPTFGSSVTCNDADLTTVREHLFQVSTYQMAILILFNSHEVMTMEMIMSETGINKIDLCRALQSLALGKPSKRVLLKIPKTNEIEPHHEFFVNESYTSELYRVRIKSIPTIGENELDRLHTKDRVHECRKHEVEARIIRIMKVRKKLTHGELTKEVTEQLRSSFIPSPVLIRKRIEYMIERKFLACAQEDRYTYIYAADTALECSTPEENIENTSHYARLWD